MSVPSAEVDPTGLLEVAPAEAEAGLTEGASRSAPPCSPTTHPARARAQPPSRAAIMVTTLTLMREFIAARPALWNGDIGEPR